MLCHLITKFENERGERVVPDLVTLPDKGDYIIGENNRIRARQLNTAWGDKNLSHNIQIRQ